MYSNLSLLSISVFIYTYQKSQSLSWTLMNLFDACLGANCQSLPQAELFVRQRERPGLPSQALAWPPRLSAGRRESGSQRPWLGEAAPQPEGSSVCAQQAPARLGFPSHSTTTPDHLCSPNPESISTLRLASSAFARHYSQNLV